MRSIAILRRRRGLKANLSTRLRNVFTDELFTEEQIQDTYGTGYESGQKEFAETEREALMAAYAFGNFLGLNNGSESLELKK